MGRSTALSAEDATRLHMGRRDNPMVIEALLAFGGRLRRETFASRFEARVLAHGRFRRAAVEPALGLGLPRWRDAPGFDPRMQIRSAPGVGSIEDVLTELVQLPLDPTKPLWRVHLLERGDGGTSVLVRVHHALADGLALIALLEELADEHPPGVPAASANAPLRRRAAWSASAAHAAWSLAAAGRLAMQRSDPPLLREGHAARKTLAFTAALPLERLTRAARARSSSLAALLLAGVAGALRTLLARRAPVDGLTLHALVPVPARRAGADGGNHYGSVLVPLPLGAPDPSARVTAVDRALERLRATGAGSRGVLLAAAAGRTPRVIERLGVAFFSRKASVMVSNVRGPAAVLHVDGVPLDDIVVWAPSPGSIALGFTLMTYAGRARIGVESDARVTESPRALADAIERELELLGA